MDSTKNIKNFQAQKRDFRTLLIFDVFDRIFFNICRRGSIISSNHNKIWQKKVLYHLKLCNTASSWKYYLCSLNGAPGDHLSFFQYWSYAILRRIVILRIFTGNQNQVLKSQNYDFSRFWCFFLSFSVCIRDI